MQTGTIYRWTFDESSGKQNPAGCPECGGRVNTTGHETNCEDCGLVLAPSTIDRGPKWRTFEDRGEQEPLERTGAPMTPIRHDDGLTTEIGEAFNNRDRNASRRKRRQLGRLRREHQRTKLRSKHERNQMRGLYEVNRVASALGLPDTVEQQASVLFRSAHDAGLVKGRSIESVATASCYAACRCAEVPRLLNTFLTAAQVTESRVLAAYDALNRDLGLPTPPPAPTDFLPQFASKLELPADVERRASKLLETAETHGLAIGRNPAGLAGASLLIAAGTSSQVATPSQGTIAEIAGISPMTIRARRDELVEL